MRPSCELRERQGDEPEGVVSHMSNRPKRRRMPKPKGPRPKKRAPGEKIEGEQECQIPGCKNFSDKNLGGRAISRDSAGDVWSSLECTTRSGRKSALTITTATTGDLISGQTRRSLDFGRRPLYPHLRQRVAFIPLRALHFMQIRFSRRRASASGNRAIGPPTCCLYLSGAHRTRPHD